MLETILIILFVCWIAGFLYPASPDGRWFGPGPAYPGVGGVLFVLLLLVLLHVI